METTNTTDGDRPAPEGQLMVAQQRTTLEAQFAEATREYEEAAALSAAGDRKALKRLPALRQKVDELKGALSDLDAVRREGARAVADDAARRAAEDLANQRRKTVELAGSYEAAAESLQRALEALGSAYESFEASRKAMRAAVTECQLGKEVEELLLRAPTSDSDDLISRHLVWTARLGHLPGLRNYIARRAESLADVTRERCERVRRALAPGEQEET